MNVKRHNVHRKILEIERPKNRILTQRDVECIPWEAPTVQLNRWWKKIDLQTLHESPLEECKPDECLVFKNQTSLPKATAIAQWQWLLDRKVCVFEWGAEIEVVKFHWIHSLKHGVEKHSLKVEVG
mmetsp:Transcript_9444/g.14326  ORF Transcript_9444/g.14326 Transcript_9444/m.14326 type:complete len:126 (-) Transcript_9444:20-397(-)